MSSKADFPHAETIDGIRFRVAPLRPKRARRLFVRAARALGSGAGGIASLDPDDLDLIFTEAEEVTQFSEDGGAKWPYLSEVNQDRLFHGRTKLSFEFLAFFLRAQFADFVVSPTSPPAGADPERGTPASSPG